MKTNLVYFSPTGTTKKILKNIAEGIGFDTEIYNLTSASNGINIKLTEGITIFGIPVYAGRVPAICAERMKDIVSNGSPAVVVAVYGNREFEDALVELRDIVTEAGFQVIAGAAFIGEHSYSSDEKPIAKGRPDGTDCDMAVEFGRIVLERFNSGNMETPLIEGNVPYKEKPKPMPITPQTNPELCSLCGACARVCPTDVITITDKSESDPAGCIMCCACIKDCPNKARYIDAPPVLERVEILYKNCSARKEPRFFI